MTKAFRLQGLDCANCAAKVERAIAKISGVTNASLNFMTTKLVIEAEETNMPAVVEEAMRTIQKLEPDVVVKKA